MRAQAEALRHKLDITAIEEHEQALERTVDKLETELTELRRLIQQRKSG